VLGTEVSASKIVADLVIAALTIRSPGAAVVSARAGKPAIRPRLPIAPKGAVAPPGSRPDRPRDRTGMVMPGAIQAALPV